MASTMSAISEGSSIFALRSSLTGAGRFSRMGVFTSPGKMFVMRIPLAASSFQAAVVSAVTANFDAS